MTLNSRNTRRKNNTPAGPGARRPFLAYLATVHRWLGVGIGLMLVLWFVSGSVLSFVPFPTLSAAERMRSAETIDAARILISPGALLSRQGIADVQRLRLVSVGGEPRYVVAANGLPVASYSAVTGARVAALSMQEARAIAQRFSRTQAISVAGPFDFDQWTVHGGYAPYRPMFRIQLQDDHRTQLYVSALTGEVVQRTTRSQRGWNYVGAVVHWLNPTFLRRDYQLWHRVMWSVAFAALILILAGLAIGIMRLREQRRLSRNRLSPFRGWLRLHHTAGLFAGLLLLSWAGSGWMSLNLGSLFSDDQPSGQQVAALRGISIATAAANISERTFSELPLLREIEVSAINGRPMLQLDGGLAGLALVEPGAGVRQLRDLPDEWLLQAVGTAWPQHAPSVLTHIDATDSYSLRSSPFPDTARRIELSDAQPTWVHVDAATGEIISVYDRSRRVYRWIVDGLHRFDFPLLNRAGNLWHVLLLAGAAVGLLFSLTGVTVALRWLRRSWRAR